MPTAAWWSQFRPTRRYTSCLPNTNIHLPTFTRSAQRFSRLSARCTTLFLALAQCRGVLVFGHHIQLASCLAAHRLLRCVSKKCAYNAPFPWIHFTFGSRSVQMTQYAVGQSLLPMPQSEIGQRSVPLTHFEIGARNIPITQCAN